MAWTDALVYLGFYLVAAIALALFVGSFIHAGNGK